MKKLAGKNYSSTIVGWRQRFAAVNFDAKFLNKYRWKCKKKVLNNLVMKVYDMRLQKSIALWIRKGSEDSNNGSENFCSKKKSFYVFGIF